MSARLPAPSAPCHRFHADSPAACRGDPALARDRRRCAAELAQERVVLDVSRADLEDVRVFVDELDLRDLHDFRDELEVVAIAGRAEHAKTDFPEALEAVWRAARFER